MRHRLIIKNEISRFILQILIVNLNDHEIGDTPELFWIDDRENLRLVNLINAVGVFGLWRHHRSLLGGRNFNLVALVDGLEERLVNLCKVNFGLLQESAREQTQFLQFLLGANLDIGGIDSGVLRADGFCLTCNQTSLHLVALLQLLNILLQFGNVHVLVIHQTAQVGNLLVLLSQLLFHGGNNASQVGRIFLAGLQLLLHDVNTLTLVLQRLAVGIQILLQLLTA